MSDASGEVMGVLAARIEERFEMSLPALRRAVMVAPHASPTATETVRWYSLLATAQEAVERAEDALVTVLMNEAPGELDDPAMELAHRVNAAVGIRDGRAMVVRLLLDPQVPGNRSPAARRGPTPTTTAPARPATPAEARGVSR
ncbi:hypothetical protein [Streptomyces sp. NPDC059076]|uniref:hypothetical protein n=1 Tax=unclassified Streptomyces TaxID=2593676 RepID=UPI003693EEA8